MNNISDKIINAIEYFKSHKCSIVECAQLFHIHRQTLSKYLYLTNNFQNRKKTSIDSMYFNTIDTEAKAYFLGLLTADGTILQNSYTIKLFLKSNDVDIINRFKMELHTEYPIQTIYNKVYNNTEMKGIVLHDVQLYNDLVYHGLKPRKSGHEQFALYINNEYISHYIRGLFDGDGCFSFGISQKQYKDKIYTNYVVEFNLSMGLPILTDIKNIFLQLGIPHINIRKIKGTYQLRISAKKSVMTIMNYLYNNANIFLQRKYDSYQQYCRLIAKPTEL